MRILDGVTCTFQVHSQHKLEVARALEEAHQKNAKLNREREIKLREEITLTHERLHHDREMQRKEQVWYVA